MHRVGRHEDFFNMIALKRHSNVRASKFKRPGVMRESIIGPWHLGHSGLSIAIGGTLERCDWDSGMMLPSNRREHKTLCHR
jgi:hypothetical protein